MSKKKPVLTQMAEMMADAAHATALAASSAVATMTKAAKTITKKKTVTKKPASVATKPKIKADRATGVAAKKATTPAITVAPPKKAARKAAKNHRGK